MGEEAVKFWGDNLGMRWVGESAEMLGFYDKEYDKVGGEDGGWLRACECWGEREMSGEIVVGV